VSNRIGIAEGDNPEVVEEQLCGVLKKERWTRTSDTLILHGRRICKPKPLCELCAVRDECDYYQTLQQERDRTSRSARATRKVRSPRR
jgi:endonuclease-3